MVQYTFAQCPEVILTVPGKDSSKARDKAMDQLFELMDEGKLPTDLPDNFGPQQFIEIQPMSSAPTADEDAINQAVQILNNLATLKLKVQESRTEALKAWSQIDLLFNDQPVDEAEMSSLREGFKVLKTFAQTNLRYREAKIQAQEARTILDQALQTPEADPKAK